MGQQEIYDYLRAQGGAWLSSRELADALGISLGSVTMSLKKLRKTSIIDFRQDGPRNGYRYAVHR